MPEKIILLYSGGLDSTVLLHLLKEEHPEGEIYCIHFNYGQPNNKQESLCVKRNCSKLGATCIQINLPEFTWTKSEFYREKFTSVESQELEFRNLIFISYAVSFAQSIGSKKIYLATLKSGGYVDTSKAFFEGVNELLANTSDIEVLTPFSDNEKWDLTDFLYKYRLGADDFFTCDTPIRGKPCGKCPDCLEVEDMLREASVNTPIKAYNRSHNTLDPVFRGLFKNSPILEARVYTNNSCQLRCNHCYYGFDKMASSPLSVKEFKSVFDQCVSLGIKLFHFSGKEPLIDDKVFEYSSYIKSICPDSTCTLVTNALRLEENLPKIISCGISEVSVSIDGIEKGDYREYDKSIVLRGAKAALDSGLSVCIFIDISEGNHNSIGDILENLYSNYGFTKFYVREISNIGKAKDLPSMSVDKLNRVYLDVYSFSERHSDAFTNISISSRIASMAVRGELGNELLKMIKEVLDFSNSDVLYNFSIFPEIYCGRYENQITITPDGYVLGCASETSCEDYAKISAGNVREDSLERIISRGKDIGLHDNIRVEYGKFDRCTFYITPIDRCY